MGKYRKGVNSRRTVIDVDVFATFPAIIHFIFVFNMILEHFDKPQDPEASQKNQPWFHGTFDIEEGGIERVTDDQRQQNTTKFWNAATFW